METKRRPNHLLAMKNTGFKQLSYDEALEKKIAADERRRNKPKSKSSQAAAERKKKDKQISDAREQRFRDAVYRRYGKRCQFPGCVVVEIPRTVQFINIHHIAPRSQRKDLIYNPDNGIPLCNFNTNTDHHKWVHDHPIQAIKMGLLSNRSRELAEKEDTVGIY